jgi:hypothetical protein
VLRGKFNPKIALFGHKIPKDDLKAVQAIYDKVESREKRYELNLYITGEDEETVDAGAPGDPVAVGLTNEPGGKEPSPGQGAEATDTPTEMREPKEG